MTRPLPRSSATAAFTMLELAIVLVIIGVVMTMGMVSYEQILETTRRSATENKMDTIEKALSSFRSRNNRLPCPADQTIGNNTAGYGAEYVVGDACGTVANSTRGAVPVKALGLPDEYMIDGWGRRFTYQADMSYDTPVFSEVPLDVPAGASPLVVNGASSSVRSSNALYVLISHGANGYGAYDVSGTQISTTGADADEVTNANYSLTTVQKDVVEGSAGTFDDIVRFKERWQIQNDEDGRNFDGSKPQLLIGGTNGAGALWLAGFKKGQGTLWVHTHNIWGSISDGMTAGAVVAGSNFKTVLFTPENEHVFVYSDSTPNCRLLRIFGNTITDVPGTPIPAAACPASYSNNNVSAMSDNGYLAIVDSSDGSVKLSKQSGDVFTSLGNLSPAAGFAATSISFSKNAELILLADNGTHIVLYNRKADGSGFSLVAATPSGFSGTITSAAISPSGRYIALTNSDSPRKLYLWRIDGSYTITPLTTAPTNSPITTTSTSSMALVFSPDSRYLGVGSDGTSNKYPVIYRIDGGDVVTAVVTPASVTGNVTDYMVFDRYSHNVSIGYNQASGTLIPALQQKDSITYISSGSALSTSRPKAAAFLH